MKLLPLIPVIASLALVACNGAEDITTIEDNTVQQECDTIAVIADSPDAACYYINTDTFYLDTDTTGHVDYDLDMDGTMDVRLDVYYSADYITHKIIPLSNVWSFAVRTNPNYGDCSFEPATIGDTLNTNPKWTSCNEYMLMIYQDQHIPGFDPFPNYNSPAYLQFRKSVNGVYKYGRVKMNYVTTVSSSYSIIGIGPSYIQK